MNILVIGGAGFIGSHVTKYHIENGDEVGIIDNYSTGNKDNLRGMVYREFQGYDIGLAWCDAVYLLAGSVGVRYVNGNPEGAIKNNLSVEMEVVRLNNVYKKPLLFASTSEVYGNSDEVPFRETQDLRIGAPDQGRWGYACSKLMGEFMVLHSDFPAVVVRFFNVVGERQVPDYGMVLPNFIQKAMDNEPIEIFGDGKAVRCFCDVKEVVPLLSTLLNNENCHTQVFNIGNPRNQVTIEELANIVVEKVGGFSKINKTPFDEVFEKNPTDILIRIPSIDKVIEYTGWVPQTTVEEIVGDMVTSGVYTSFNK